MAGFFTLAFIFFVFFSEPVFANGTKSSGFIVEYEDLKQLLQSGNSSLKQIKENQEDSRKPYEEMQEILKEEAKEMEKMADSYEDDGNTKMQKFYEDRADQLKTAASQVGSRLRKMSSSSQNKTYEKQTETLLVTAQTLMISYNQMSGQIEAQEKGAEAASASYEAAKTGYEAGIAKSGEVAEAMNDFHAAQNTLDSLKEQAEKLKTQLLKMLGLENDGTVEIGSVLKPDPDVIDTIDFETDKLTAVSNDSTYVSELNSSVKGTDARILRSMRVSDAADTELVSITQAYQELQNKKLLYDAALSAYEAARLDYDALLRKKQAGLLSNAELLEGEASWLSKKASMSEASMNLFQAYETYCWEVKGRV